MKPLCNIYIPRFYSFVMFCFLDFSESDQGIETFEQIEEIRMSWTQGQLISMNKPIFFINCQTKPTPIHTVCYDLYSDMKFDTLINLFLHQMTLYEATVMHLEFDFKC